MPARWHASTVCDYLAGRYDLGYGIRGKLAQCIKGLMRHLQVMHLRDLGCSGLLDSMESQAATSWPYIQIWKLPPYLVPAERGGLGGSGFTQKKVVVDADGFHTPDAAGNYAVGFRLRV